MKTLSLVVMAVGLALVAPRAARAQGAMCVNSATGVPDTYGQPPLDWWTFGSTPTPNDPRWVGASGHSLTSGSASAPVELRSVWASVGGQNYLCLSWQFFVDTSIEASSHALYLGFQTPATATTPSETHILRYAFRGSSSSAAVQYCDDPESCTPDASFTQYQPAPLSLIPCAGIPDLTTAQRFAALGSSTMSWADDTARYWREAWVGTIDRWTVQIRIPIDATPSITDGVPEGTKISYQATLESATVGGAFYYEPWPRDSLRPTQFCLLDRTPSTIIMDNPARFRTISLTGSSPAPAEGCSGNVRVDQIGVQDPGNPTGPLITTMATSGAINLVARVINESAAEIAIGALTAHFRMANWGAQSFVGAWSDVPFPTSGPHPGEATNAVKVPAKDPTTMVPGTADIVLGPWTLTGAERCQYTWWQGRFGGGWPVAAECALCDDPTVVGVDQLGAQWRGGACLSGKSQHQCTAVELRGGDVDWSKRSVYNNLDFAALSVDAREALIDTRGLPKAPGQKDHDIYFVVMPRNMPAARDEKTYAQLTGDAARRMLEQILLEAGEGPPNPNHDDYHEGPYDKLPPRVRDVAKQLDDLAQYGPQKQPDMSNEAFVDALARRFPPDVLVQLVPSLEVYVYYAVPQKHDRTALLPMTSFTLITHHDGTVNGFAWALDGTEHVAGNVYRKTIPVDKVARVRVQIEAVGAGGPTIRHDDDWPCGCTCGGKTCPGAVAGNGGLITLAFLWANRRRRRRGDEPAL